MFSSVTHSNEKTDGWQDVQNEFYSDADQHSHLTFNRNSLYSKDLSDHLVEAARISPNDEVLEIGAGAGRFSIHLAKVCKHLVALDTSSALLDALKSQQSEKNNIDVLCASVFDLLDHFKKISLDVVCGFFILHHLPHHDKLFGLIKTVLKPGGRISFVEPNRMNPLFLAQAIFDPEMTWDAEKGMFKFSASKTVKILNELGFVNLKRERFGFFPPQVLDKFPSSMKIQNMIEKIILFRRILPFILITADKPS
ncbi:MAG: methyltransferase domain-containing protein [Bacteroidota bacterium]|nr:methyltransferase domain-containing protein [Bacteroidota bacterium]